MAIWAIVPVKPLAHGKSRLSSVLNTDERMSLNIRLLKKTLETISNVPEIEKTLIVTNDPEVVKITQLFHFDVCIEENECGMNRALDRGIDILKRNQVRSAIILPSDLPFVTVREIQVMIKMGSESKAMVIAPDRKKQGTNAIFYHSLEKVDFEFGPMSFDKHVKSAKANGVPICIFESDTFGLDIDLPEDLMIYRSRIPAEAAT
jgi:2-phospho-L-lactate guanylyltransferase